MTDTDKETLARLAYEVGRQQAAVRRLEDSLSPNAPSEVVAAVLEVLANHARMVSVIYGMREDSE